MTRLRLVVWLGVVACAPTACSDVELDSLGRSRIHPQLIDDLEDADAAIPSVYGRSGRWYVFNDGTGEQVPNPPLPRALSKGDAPPGLDASRFAIYTRAAGFELWGAGIGVSVAGDDLDSYYDATRYRGVRFYARGTIQGTQSVRVNFPSSKTGTQTECDGSLDCNNHFGQSIQLSEQWAHYEVLFEDLSQEILLSETREFQRGLFRDVQFLVTRLRDFELWIDELEFVQ